jgi:hypothetical protein
MKSYAQALRGNNTVALKAKTPVAENQEASSSSAVIETDRADVKITTTAVAQGAEANLSDNTKADIMKSVQSVQLTQSSQDELAAAADANPAADIKETEIEQAKNIDSTPQTEQI